MITGLNHITIAVTDLQTSLTFYRDVLGCSLARVWPNGAYLEAGSLWLCLSVCDVVELRNDYSHIAFSIDGEAISAFELILREEGVEFWQENNSEGDSLYFLDPDGYKLEVHVGNLSSRMNHYNEKCEEITGCGVDA